MRIGIDIDGVLTDEKRYVIDYGTKFFTENKIPYTVSDDRYLGVEIFNVTKEQYQLFLKDYIFQYSLKAKIRPFASKVVKKLKENHEIFIITARDFTTYENEHKIEMQENVKKWLRDNGIVYDEIIFSKEKACICKDKKIDVMIEDSPENIESISKIIPVICYSQIYNKNISNKNVYRCYSWYEIYNQINLLENK